MPRAIRGRKELTNDLEWYSRLAIWAGIAVLLIQSVTGENPSWVTVIAVILLAGGLGVFVVALARAGAQQKKAGLRSRAVSSPDGGPTKP